jgi:WD40 repeat protein
MHLHGHVNRHANIEACFSPCGRFIASGSEDNRGYVYDIRTGLVLYKIGLNHGNVVTSVSYNPSKAELVTGCYDGKLRVFK